MVCSFFILLFSDQTRLGIERKSSIWFIWKSNNLWVS